MVKKEFLLIYITLKKYLNEGAAVGFYFYILVRISKVLLHYGKEGLQKCEANKVIGN